MTTAMVGNWLAPCLTVENGSQLAPDPRSHSFHAIVAYRLDVQSIMIATSSAPLDQELFNRQADAIAEAGKYVAGHGWTPATSSNFSARLDDSRIAVTISGRDKGRLGREDIMVVDYQGQPVGSQHRPSAETLLHTQIYQRFPEAQAILHTHSRQQSVASRFYAAEGVVRFEGWELQKAITGHTTHESVIEVPVLPNSQHMPELMAQVDAWLDAGKPLHAYLISGHGIYTWGRTMQETLRHLEAFEFLLGCELDLRRLSP